MDYRLEKLLETSGSPCLILYVLFFWTVWPEFSYDLECHVSLCNYECPDDVWGFTTFQEKAPYVAKAEKRKVEYEKNIKAYNKKLV